MIGVTPLISAVLATTLSERWGLLFVALGSLCLLILFGYFLAKDFMDGRSLSGFSLIEFFFALAVLIGAVIIFMSN